MSNLRPSTLEPAVKKPWRGGNVPQSRTREFGNAIRKLPAGQTKSWGGGLRLQRFVVCGVLIGNMQSPNLCVFLSLSCAFGSPRKGGLVDELVRNAYFQRLACMCAPAPSPVWRGQAERKTLERTGRSLVYLTQEVGLEDTRTAVRACRITSPGEGRRVQ